MPEDGPRPLRILYRTAEGALRDPDGQRPVGLEEFCSLLQAGERLRVQQESTGADCTMDVLLRLVTAYLPRPPDTEGGLLG